MSFKVCRTAFQVWISIDSSAMSCCAVFLPSWRFVLVNRAGSGEMGSGVGAV